MLKVCEAWREQLCAYLDGETNAHERAEIEAHVNTCPDCRAMLELYRCDEQDVTATLQAREASPGFAAGVLARVEAIAAGQPDPAETARRKQTARQPLPPWRNLREWLQWGLAFGLMGLLLAIILPNFSPNEQARQATCTAHVQELNGALLRYTREHHGAFPDAAQWAQAIAPYVKSKADFTCPQDSQRNLPGATWPISYHYNSGLAGLTMVSLKAKEETPLVWCEGHNGLTVGFADGSCKTASGLTDVGEYALAQLEQRDPKAATSIIPLPMTQAPAVTSQMQGYRTTDGKMLIAYSANVALETPNVQRAVEQVEATIQKYDGIITASDFRRQERERAIAVVSGRVPCEKMEATLSNLGSLGTLISRRVSSTDLSGAPVTPPDPADHPKPRIKERPLYDQVALTDITVELAMKAAPAPNNPVQAAQMVSVKALKVFLVWLAAVVIVVLIWMPTLGSTWYLLKRRQTVRR